MQNNWCPMHIVNVILPSQSKRTEKLQQQWPVITIIPLLHVYRVVFQTLRKLPLLPSDYSLKLVVASKSSSKCPFGSHYAYRNKFKTKFAAIQLPKNTIKFQKRHLNNKPRRGPLIPKNAQVTMDGNGVEEIFFLFRTLSEFELLIWY